MNKALAEILSWSANNLKQKQQVLKSLRPMLDSLHKRAASANTESERSLLIKGYEQIAQTCQKSVNTEFTREAVEAALQLKPKSLELRIQLMRLQESDHRLEAAWELGTDILDEHPNIDNPSAVICLARLYSRAKQYQKANELLHPALRMQMPDQQKAEIWFQYAKNLHQLGDYIEAFEHYKIANQIMYNSDIAHKFSPNAKALLNKIKKLTHWYSKGNLLSSPHNIQDKDPKPIFLVGFPRSGTTLLEQILDSHTGISCVSERPVLQPLLQQFYAEPERFSQIFSKKNAQNWRALRDEYWRRLQFFHGQPVNEQLIVDKLPLNIYYLIFINFLFPEAKIIVSLRDPRDVVLSNFMQNFRINEAMWHSFELDRLLMFYRSVMTLYQQNKEVSSELYLEVRYESLITKFNETCHRLTNYLEVPAYSTRPDYIYTAKQKRIFTPSYNQVIQPLYEDAIDRWKHYEPFMAEYFSILDETCSVFNYRKL